MQGTFLFFNGRPFFISEYFCQLVSFNKIGMHYFVHDHFNQDQSCINSFVVYLFAGFSECKLKALVSSSCFKDQIMWSLCWDLFFKKTCMTRIFPTKMFHLHLLEDRLEDPMLVKIQPAYKVVFIFGCIVRKAGSNLDALLENRLKRRH